MTGGFVCWGPYRVPQVLEPYPHDGRCGCPICSECRPGEPLLLLLLLLLMTMLLLLLLLLLLMMMMMMMVLLLFECGEAKEILVVWGDRMQAVLILLLTVVRFLSSCA